MSTQPTPTPTTNPSPYLPAVTETDPTSGEVTTVFPGSLTEYATLATAQRVQSLFDKSLPECGPFQLVDGNAGSTQKWSQPEWSLVANNGQQFNAGLLYSLISQGGYNKGLAFKQVRNSVLGY